MPGPCHFINDLLTPVPPTPACFFLAGIWDRGHMLQESVSSDYQLAHQSGGTSGSSPRAKLRSDPRATAKSSWKKISKKKTCFGDDKKYQSPDPGFKSQSHWQYLRWALKIKDKVIATDRKLWIACGSKKADHKGTMTLTKVRNSSGWFPRAPKHILW